MLQKASVGLMPNRVLRESITTSASIDVLSPHAECFFYRLLTVVDDYGRQDARPSVLRAKCFPLRVDTVKAEHVAGWLEELIDAQMAIVYVGPRGGTFVQLVNWERHRPSGRRSDRSKFPEPSEEFPGNPRMSEEILGNPRKSEEISEFPKKSARDRDRSNEIRDRETTHENDPCAAANAEGDEGVCDPFGVFDAVEERGPRMPVLPVNDDRTARDWAFTAFKTAYPPNPDGTEWSWHDARKAWQEHVPPGDEDACQAKLALYAESPSVRRGRVRAPANWLPGWREQKEPAPEPAQPARTGGIPFRDMMRESA